MYYLNGKDGSELQENLNELYNTYPCDESDYDDFLFVAGFSSLSRNIKWIDDLETLQLFILLEAVDRFKIVYKDSHEYIRFLNILLDKT